MPSKKKVSTSFAFTTPAVAAVAETVYADVEYDIHVDTVRRRAEVRLVFGQEVDGVFVPKAKSEETYLLSEAEYSLMQTDLDKLITRIEAALESSGRAAFVGGRGGGS